MSEGSKSLTAFGHRTQLFVTYSAYFTPAYQYKDDYDHIVYICIQVPTQLACVGDIPVDKSTAAGKADNIMYMHE
jgi:hypothetical protein